jgi:predicted amidophosphoribosyltransferase
MVARSLERCHGIPVLRTLLRTAGAQQKSLDYQQRKDNLKGQISLSPRARWEAVHGHRADSAHDAVPRHAVLLDDVFTTGATLDACARALRAAGCIEVNAVTLVMEE